MKNTIRITALVLLFFNGISAIFGGVGLMSDPSGATLRMPLEFLDNTPFKDFLIPGVILFTFNGILSIMIFVFTSIKVKGYAWFIIFEGCVLTTWLTVQIIMIGKFYPPLHIPYYLVGLLLILIGSLLARK
jgi:hypothetical protein